MTTILNGYNKWRIENNLITIQKWKNTKMTSGYPLIVSTN